MLITDPLGRRVGTGAGAREIPEVDVGTENELGVLDDTSEVATHAVVRVRAALTGRWLVECWSTSSIGSDVDVEVEGAGASDERCYLSLSVPIGIHGSGTAELTARDTDSTCVIETAR
ncbi:MAG: hypothetical protein U0527_03350 [Candidatus Eisenbacteria bacterium]